MLGSLILYLKGMRIMMFQLSGFYCTSNVSLRSSVHQLKRSILSAPGSRVASKAVQLESLLKRHRRSGFKLNCHNLLFP